MIDSDPRLLAAIGPRVRKSPLFDCTVRAGLSAVSTYNHMWLPMSYGDLDAEYERLTRAVSMWDVTAQRHVEVSGSDADALTQFVTAVDITTTPSGHAVYAPMVDAAGTLINDPVLLHWSDGSWRFSIADSDVELWLKAVADGRGFDVTVRERDTVTIAVQGPRAHGVAAALGWPWTESLDTFEMRPATVATDAGDVEVVLCRSGWSNQGGIEIFCDDPDAGPAVWDAVRGAGEPFDIGPGAPNATERLENTFLSYGTDTGYHADPIELGMTDSLDLDGPEFIGQRALHDLASAEPERRLRGCVIDGEPIGVLPHPVPLRIGDDIVGLLRSGSDSPRFGTNIGLALIDARCETGAVGSVTLPAGVGTRALRLVDLPFAESLDEASPG